MVGGKTILFNPMPLFLKSQVKLLKKNSVSPEDTKNLNINYWRRNSCQGVNLYRHHPRTSVPKLIELQNGIQILMHFNFFWYWKISPKIGLCGFWATDLFLPVWKAGRYHFTSEPFSLWHPGHWGSQTGPGVQKSLHIFLKGIFFKE